MLMLKGFAPLYSHGTNGFLFSQAPKSFYIPNTWIVLDSRSTVDLLCNAMLLQNLRPAGSNMHVHCNAGKCTTNLVGDVPGYGTVRYDAKATANILSLKQVKTKYHVSFDSELSNAFIVTKPNGKTRVKGLREKGLSQPHYSMQHIEGYDLLCYKDKIYIPQSLRQKYCPGTINTYFIPDRLALKRPLGIT